MPLYINVRFDQIEDAPLRDTLKRGYADTKSKSLPLHRRGKKSGSSETPDDDMDDDREDLADLKEEMKGASNAPAATGSDLPESVMSKLRKSDLKKASVKRKKK